MTIHKLATKGGKTKRRQVFPSLKKKKNKLEGQKMKEPNNLLNGDVRNWSIKGIDGKQKNCQ